MADTTPTIVPKLKAGRHAKIFTFGGHTGTMREHAKRLGITREALYHRLKVVFQTPRQNAGPAPKAVDGEPT